MSFPDDLYDFPVDHVGRRQYVSVREHSRSVPKFKTYKGCDGYNHIRPEFGGDGSGMGTRSTYVMPDKAPYLSPMDGTVVSGRRAHRDHMLRHDVIEVGDQVGYGRENRDVHAPLTGRDIADTIRQLGGH